MKRTILTALLTATFIVLLALAGWWLHHHGYVNGFADATDMLTGETSREVAL